MKQQAFSQREIEQLIAAYGEQAATMTNQTLESIRILRDAFGRDNEPASALSQRSKRDAKACTTHMIMGLLDGIKEIVGLMELSIEEWRDSHGETIFHVRQANAAYRCPPETAPDPAQE